MTTICAVRWDDRIVIAADRGTASTYRLPERNKLYTAGQWVFGGAGQTAVLQAIEVELPTLLPTVNGLADMVCVINDLRRVLADDWGVRSDANADDIREIQAPLLIAGPPGLFYVSEDGGVLDVPKFKCVAIGSGERFALGAMCVEPRRSPEQLVGRGLFAAYTYDLFTGVAGDIETVPLG